MRAWLLVVVVAGCTTSDPELAASSFARANYCPRTRLRAWAVPGLAIEPVTQARVPEWNEPGEPPDIASDPERAALWRADRDAAYRAWWTQRERARVVDREPVFEVTGCDAAQLYACSHHRYSSSCRPLADAWTTSVRLACGPGSVPRANGGHVACMLGEPIADAAACMTACGPGAEQTHCALGCATTSLQQCRDSGLGNLGLCDALAQQQEQLRGLDLQLSARVAMFDKMTAAKAVLDSLLRDNQTCMDSCRHSPDSHALVDCMQRCSSTAREQCERDVTPATRCDGLRAQELALRRTVSAP
jgi:hypothetical protein